MKKLPTLILIALLCMIMHGCHSNKGAVRSPQQTTQRVLPTSLANDIVREAERWIGTPYKYGAYSRKSGTDCSGMVMTIFKDKAGVTLPHHAASQQQLCKKIVRAELRPGDLVFFSDRRGGSRVSHVGIYRGRGEFIHAPRGGVMISNLDKEEYWRSHYHSGGRVMNIATAKAEKAVEPPTSESDILEISVDALPGALMPQPLNGATISPDLDAALRLDSIITNSVDSIFAP